jgi:glycosyltransferase involved in cell wall biosynthesis
MRMRILYVCSDFGVPVFGHKGASIHVRAMAGAFADLGHTIRILSPAIAPEAHPEFDVPVETPVSLEAHTETLAALRRTDKRLGIMPSGHAARVAQEGRNLLYNHALAGAAERLRGFGADLVYERSTLFGFGGLDLARALGVPHVLEVNAPLCDEQERARGLHLGDVARAIEAAVWRGTDAFLAVSEEIRAQAEALDIAPARLHVLPNGVDAARFAIAPETAAQVRRAWGLGDGPVIGFVGSLKAWHGTDVLVDAFAQIAPRFPAAKLLIVGEGPTAAALRQQAIRHGITASVCFTGAVDHGHIPALLAAMDVTVAPYRATDDFYFSPIKVYEYLAAGKPVIATPIGQIAALVEAGYVEPAPAADAAGLAAAIAAVLADPAAAGARAARGRAWTLAERTWAANARRVVELASACAATRA